MSATCTYTAVVDIEVIASGRTIARRRLYTDPMPSHEDAAIDAERLAYSLDDSFRLLRADVHQTIARIVDVVRRCLPETPPRRGRGREQRQVGIANDNSSRRRVRAT